MVTDIREWINSTHKETNYLLTQALTGHREYRNYAENIGKENTDKCRYCRQTDTTEQPFFKCTRWMANIISLEIHLNTKLTKQDMIEAMVESKQNR